MPLAKTPERMPSLAAAYVYGTLGALLENNGIDTAAHRKCLHAGHPLTQREERIFVQIAQGQSRAALMKTSENNYQSMNTAIARTVGKVGAQNLSQAIFHAHRLGIVGWQERALPPLLPSRLIGYIGMRAYGLPKDHIATIMGAKPGMTYHCARQGLALFNTLAPDSPPLLTIDGLIHGAIRHGLLSTTPDITKCGPPLMYAQLRTLMDPQRPFKAAPFQSPEAALVRWFAEADATTFSVMHTMARATVHHTTSG